jgi:protein N-terminal methyltransferase
MSSLPKALHFGGADCGAGVGRVTEQLLLEHFAEVDLVEPSEHLLSKARESLSGPGCKAHPGGHRAVGFFRTGLEGWMPETQRYC